MRKFTALLLLFVSAEFRGNEDTAPNFSARIQNEERPESLLFSPQKERRVVFKSMDRFYPTRLIEATDNTYALEPAKKDLSNIGYDVEGTSYTVKGFLASPYSKGFIVVQDNKILLEYYDDSHNEKTRWVSFSVTKSVTSMLIGAAIKDGFITSVDEPVAHYLPRLRGTPYETATIEDLLHMSSGVKWNEDYFDPKSDVARAGGANGIALVSHLAQLPQEHTPGEVFNYNTGETNLAGEILRSAIGNNASTYLQLKIWQPFGMEFQANWLLDSLGGGETGGCCISATLRDYARLGIFAMRNGVLVDGTETLPDNWMLSSTTPSEGAAYYGYLWWLGGEGSYADLVG